MDSEELHGNVNPIGEDFRSLLETNSRENSEITSERTRLINAETASQMSKKLKEIKTDLNSQILQPINSAITEKVFPTLQTSLGMQENGFSAKVDLLANGLQGTPRL